MRNEDGGVRKEEGGIGRIGRFGRIGRLLETRAARAKREADAAEILRRAQNDREAEEKVKVEAEVKAREEAVKKAKHNAWVKCHVALCSEIAAPGNPRKADLVRWMGRLAGTNVLGYAMLQDLKEIVYLGLHYEEARAMLRLAVATNAVALYARDEEVVRAQAEVEEQSHESTKDTKGDRIVQSSESRVQNPELAERKE